MYGESVPKFTVVLCILHNNDHPMDFGFNFTYRLTWILSDFGILPWGFDFFDAASRGARTPNWSIAVFASVLTKVLRRLRV